uniref:THH1/TOM1/TOM3 domain-containing protein n=1 Tax=Setaria digitata TaxID=48799 RepID=A0A915Q3R4_9BILA
MSVLWKWLTGKRNECTVTYSRFGVPVLASDYSGDVLEDRPRPSTICIAQFDDNDPKFIFFKLCHAERAAAVAAGFGMSSVIFIFISTFLKFDWYSHRTGIDVVALAEECFVLNLDYFCRTAAFLLLYLGIGILVHYQVIAGIKKRASYYLLPFIISYIIAIDVEALFIFIHMLHIHSPSLDYSFKEESDVFYIFSITVLSILILFQGFMLKAVSQCRYYLSCKEIHLFALKVAESSRTKYPGIQVVFVSSAFNMSQSVNITNGNRVADEAVIERGVNSTW